MRRLRPSTFLAFYLLTICLVSILPAVEAAQTTMIYRIDSPASAVAGSENPLTVAVTVYYNNTVTGDQLVVGILDNSFSPARIVPGAVVLSTDPCVNERMLAAVCAVIVPKSSGVERIDFQIGGILGGRGRPGSWNLNATSVLKDSQNNLIPGSVSSKVFRINLIPVELNVNVPPNVTVSVDGMLEPPGPVSVGVALGQHNITVPQFVNVSQSTRLNFDHWSDGYTSTLRIIVVTNSTTLQANYITQNLLTLIGEQGNTTVSTWYNANSNATFSTDEYEPMAGWLGGLGVRLSFQGWFENGQLLTNSPTGTISMDKPHTLTALWRLDYSIPALIALGSIAAAAVIFLLARRRNRNRPTRRSRSKRRRSRS